MIPQEMTLRDWFAGQAINGLTSHYATAVLTKDDFKHFSQKSYSVADAMMEARKSER